MSEEWKICLWFEMRCRNNVKRDSLHSWMDQSIILNMIMRHTPHTNSSGELSFEQDNG